MWVAQRTQELQAPMLGGSDDESARRRPFEFLTNIFKRRRDNDDLFDDKPPDIDMREPESCNVSSDPWGRDMRSHLHSQPIASATSTTTTPGSPHPHFFEDISRRSSPTPTVAVITTTSSSTATMPDLLQSPLRHHHHHQQQHHLPSRTVSPSSGSLLMPCVPLGFLSNSADASAATSISTTSTTAATTIAISAQPFEMFSPSKQTRQQQAPPPPPQQQVLAVAVSTSSCLGMAVAPSELSASSSSNSVVLHHTPSKSRDIREDIEAIRLSRQDNPYLQRVADSQSGLDDDGSDEEEALTSQAEDKAHLVTQTQSSQETLSLTDVHEHLIRSPPPTSMPKGAPKCVFVFPVPSDPSQETPPPQPPPAAAAVSAGPPPPVAATPVTSPSSQAGGGVGGGGGSLASLKPVVARGHQDVLDQHLRHILHSQRQLIVSKDNMNTTCCSVPGSPAHPRSMARRSPHARTLSEEAAHISSVGAGGGGWSGSVSGGGDEVGLVKGSTVARGGGGGVSLSSNGGDLAPVLPPGRRPHSPGELLLTPPTPQHHPHLHHHHQQHLHHQQQQQAQQPPSLPFYPAGSHMGGAAGAAAVAATLKPISTNRTKRSVSLRSDLNASTKGSGGSSSSSILSGSLGSNINAAAAAAAAAARRNAPGAGATAKLGQQDMGSIASSSSPFSTTFRAPVKGLRSTLPVTSSSMAPSSLTTTSRGLTLPLHSTHQPATAPLVDMS